MDVQELVNENLISPSIANLIFSADEYKRYSRLKDDMLIPTSDRICAIYASLIHAYIIGQAIHLGKTVDKLPYEHTAPKIIDFWNTSIPVNFNDMFHYSMLISAMEDADPEWFDSSAKEMILMVRDVYRIYSHDVPRGNLSRQVDFHCILPEDFKKLLKSLPLLKNTVFDSYKFTFSFPFNNGFFCVKCFPFIGYWNAEKNMVVETETDCVNLEEEPPNEVCVPVGAKKGGTRSQLRLETLVLNGIRDTKNNDLVTKTIQCSLNNEYLRMIFGAVNQPVESSLATQSSCDLSFLKTLNDTVVETLNNLWADESWEELEDSLNPENPGVSTADEKLRIMFDGTELDNAITKKIINDKEIANTFYELFINYGIFKTMYALFLDSKSEVEYGNMLFDKYFENINILTEETISSYKRECNERIENHLNTLKSVVPETSPIALNCRKKAIKAEWRAYYALKAAGLQADKLFTEQESIKSIDDYYYMIKNSSTQLADDLNEVLMLLVCFYKALLSADIPFNKSEFHKTMWKERKKIKGASITTLLDTFAEIVETSSNNAESLEHYVGRTCICDIKNLGKYIRLVKRYFNDTNEEQSSISNETPKIFISYSHKDVDLVKQCARAWEVAGLPIYIDTSEFHAGDDWIVKAKKFIHSSDCKVVVVFVSENSVKSQAVLDELNAAKEAAQNKFKDYEKQNRFIIPINLDTEREVGDFLYDKLNKSSSNGGFEDDIDHIPRQIAAIIHKDKIHRRLCDDYEKVIQELKDALSVKFDGTLDTSQREYSPLEFAVASFYTYLKFGDAFQNGCKRSEIDEMFKNTSINGATCIFPLVTAVKETKIKRDNITLMGYEIIGDKEKNDSNTNYILSSARLSQDDYYCLPNCHTTAKDCSWMIEPLLISCDMFVIPPEED